MTASTTPAEVLRRATYVTAAVRDHVLGDRPLPDDVTTSQWARLMDTPPELLDAVAGLLGCTADALDGAVRWARRKEVVASHVVAVARAVLAEEVAR